MGKPEGQTACSLKDRRGGRVVMRLFNIFGKMNIKLEGWLSTLSVRLRVTATSVTKETIDHF